MKYVHRERSSDMILFTSITIPTNYKQRKKEKSDRWHNKKSPILASRFSITLIIDQTGCLVVHFIKNQITILIIRETYTNKKTYIYLCKYSRRTQTG